MFDDNFLIKSPLYTDGAIWDVISLITTSVDGDWCVVFSDSEEYVIIARIFRFRHE